MVKESDTARADNFCIARETLESMFSWDSERTGKTEIVDNRKSVE